MSQTTDSSCKCRTKTVKSRLRYATESLEMDRYNNTLQTEIRDTHNCVVKTYCTDSTTSYGEQLQTAVITMLEIRLLLEQHARLHK